MKNKKAVKIDLTDASTLLNCKSCAKEVSISADNCPACGDSDPFGFAMIDELSEKYERKKNIAIIVVVILSLMIGSVTVWWVGLISFFVLGLIVQFIFSLVVVDNYFAGPSSYYWLLYDKMKKNISGYDANQTWGKYAMKIRYKHK